MEELPDLNVYKVWPVEAINEAISEFNHQMHNDAGIEEIKAGLHGLDFLTRNSDMDDMTSSRLEGAIIEAEMRVELMAAKEAEERTLEENYERALKGMKLLQQQIRSIENRFIKNPPIDPESVQKYVEQRCSNAN